MKTQLFFPKARLVLFFLIYLFLTMFSNLINAQNAGDYQSKMGGGNWTDPSSWQIYNGFSWNDATEYPGQTGSSTTATVTIQGGSTVSFPTPIGNISNPAAYTFGDLIINGILNIGDGNSNSNWYVGFPGTQSILISNGSLFLRSKNGDSNLYLPTDATIFILNGGRIQGDVCNNNKNIYIGSLRYAACQGSGQTYTDFSSMETSGGSLRAQPISNPQAICGSSGSALIESANTEIGITYQWTLPASGGWSGSTSTNSKTLGTISFSQPGQYIFKLKVTAIRKIGGNSYTLTDEQPLVVTVGQTNTVTAASSSPSVCLGAPISNITHNTTVANGIDKPGIAGANGLPPGVVAYWAQDKITISGTPAAAGIFNYSIPLTGGCGSVSATGTITVNTKPAINAMAATICSGTVFNVTPVNGTNGTVPPVINYSWNAPAMPAGLSGGVAGSGSSISGTLSNSTGSALNAVYTVTPSSGSCGTGSAFTVTITVPASNTAGLPSSSPTVCVNTAMPTVSISTTGATGIGTATGLPAGVSASWSSGTITLSGTPTASGTFNYSIPLTGGCGTASATGTITVTASSSAGLPSASPKVCVNTAIPTISIATTGATGIGTATGLPSGVSATWSGNMITISGTPTVSGTFNYSIPLSGGCGNGSATGTIFVNLVSVFNGTWSNGVPDNNGLAAEIAADYNTSSGSFNACSCTVNVGKTLTISPNTFVKIENGLVNNGTVIVESDANLIQVNDTAVNQGNVVVKRAFTFSQERKQYNYVSSPVIGGNIRDIYPGSPEAIYHSESTNMFYTSSGANIQGRALAIKEPAKAAVSDATVTASFVGVPFNGILKYPLSYTTANPAVSHGYNLVGNPYPSDLDIDALFDDNNAKIDPTFSFWDNRGNTVYVQQGSAYNGANYTRYNGISETGVPAGVPASTSGPRIPNQFVKVGSGFMVRARSTANGATLDFKNAYRSDNNTGPGFFGKSSTKDRYWLKLNTPGGIELMTAVVYFPNGNNDFSLDDSAGSNSSDDIYTFAAQTAVAINGRAPFSQSDRVMVGVNSFTSGNYTISLGNMEGVFANGQNIYLKDHLTGIVTNLSEGSYTFSISAGQSTGRFELIYEPGSVLATGDTGKDELMVYKDGQDFVVAAKAKKITGLEVYDLLGRMIYRDAPQKTKTVIDASVMTTGVYIFRIDQGGKITTRKVIK